MRDMNDFIGIIKRVAINAVNAQKLTDIVHGTVLSVSPLKVQIDQKLILENEHLKLTRAVMDYEVEMTVDHVTENQSGGSGEGSFASHTHAYTGKKKFKIHNGLKTGDKVTMIRVQGGQNYLVIDKE